MSVLLLPSKSGRTPRPSDCGHVWCCDCQSEYNRERTGPQLYASLCNPDLVADRLQIALRKQFVDQYSCFVFLTRGQRRLRIPHYRDGRPRRKRTLLSSVLLSSSGQSTETPTELPSSRSSTSMPSLALRRPLRRVHKGVVAAPGLHADTSRPTCAWRYLRCPSITMIFSDRIDRSVVKHQPGGLTRQCSRDNRIQCVKWWCGSDGRRSCRL